MPYDTFVDDEFSLMLESIKESNRAIEKHEIQVPIGILMHEPLLIEMDRSVSEAVKIMTSHNVGYVLVVSAESKKLRGIFSERDLVLKILGKIPMEDWTKAPVSDFMKKEPAILHHEDLLDQAIIAMGSGRYRHMPVVNDKNQPIGIISVRYIISYLIEHFPSEILNLPPVPIRDAAMKSREGA